ncbi:MAG: hypothetical protein ACQEUM_12115 [Pseudomonadota bacterium]
MHCVSKSDIRAAYGLRSLAAADKWCQHSTFPRPIATYGQQRRPLYDPAEVDAWVRAHRPEYVAQAAGEVQ